MRLVKAICERCDMSVALAKWREDDDGWTPHAVVCHGWERNGNGDGFWRRNRVKDGVPPWCPFAAEQVVTLQESR